VLAPLCCCPGQSPAHPFPLVAWQRAVVGGCWQGAGVAARCHHQAEIIQLF
jgi:hypothetical protein